MPEETVVAADATPASETQVATAAVTEKPAASAEWRDGLSGDYAEFAKNMASPHDAVRYAVDARKDMSTRIKLPGKDAKPEDIAKFNKAIGAGENPDDYKFPTVEGKEPSESEALVAKKVAEVLHKHHVPVAAAPELHAVVSEIAANIDAENERVAVKGREDNEAALRKEWGRDFDGNVQLAMRAAQTFGGDGFKTFLNSTMINGIKLGDHPEFMRVFGQIGRRMGEGQFIGAVGTEEKSSIAQLIDSKTREMLTAQQKGDRAKAQTLNAELFELQAKLHGNQPIVGAQGRTA